MTDGLFTSALGMEAFRLKGQAFHSAYDPKKEVIRYLDSVGPLPEDAVLILWGETLGHITRELKTRYPRSRVVSLVPSAALTERSSGADLSLFTESPGEFQAMLDKEVREDNFSRCRFLVWPAARRILPDMTEKWETLFLGHFRRMQGSVLTQAYFGPRWLANTLRNLQFFRHYPAPTRISRPIIVAASGPSLGEARDTLRRRRNHYYLLALPSSLRALKEWGITPDAVMVTDGGYWSRVHLKYLCIDTAILQCPSAVFAPEISNTRSFFTQGLEYEKEILGTDSSIPSLPSQGTVAASALTWACRTGSGPIAVLGLDLAFKTGRSHVYPHTFESEDLHHPGRCSPSETFDTQLRLEAGLKPLGGGYETTPSLETYASYFSSYSPGRPVYRCLPAPRNFPGFLPIDIPRLEEILSGFPRNPDQEILPGQDLGMDFSRRTQDWIARRLKDLENRLSGQPASESLSALTKMLWPLRENPDWNNLAAVLERNYFALPPI